MWYSWYETRALRSRSITHVVILVRNEGPPLEKHIRNTCGNPGTKLRQDGPLFHAPYGPALERRGPRCAPVHASPTLLSLLQPRPRPIQLLPIPRLFLRLYLRLFLRLCLLRRRRLRRPAKFFGECAPDLRPLLVIRD